ncbi:MAG: alpha/beta hydrolase [Niastella sp.]|nr:alpha/beta hydrolase [Niastella sp.]
MKIYIFSGLGADKRVFVNLKLPHQFEAVHIDWEIPGKEETLESYALRLAKNINKSEPFMLLGVSMGGMIATEISKKFQPLLTILISSVPLANELPGLFKWTGRFGLHKLIPAAMYKNVSIAKRIFTTEQPQNKLLIRQVIKDTDPRFVTWAVNAILNWHNETLPNPYVHIHGKEDEVLPVKNTHPTHIIMEGKHLLVLENTEALNAILKEILTPYQ